MDCDWFADPGNYQYYHYFDAHAPEDCKRKRKKEKCKAMPEWCKNIQCQDRRFQSKITLCLRYAPGCQDLLQQCGQ